MMPRAPCTRHAHGYSGLLTRLPDMSGSSIRFRLISGLERTPHGARQTAPPGLPTRHFDRANYPRLPSRSGRSGPRGGPSASGGPLPYETCNHRAAEVGDCVPAVTDRLWKDPGGNQLGRDRPRDQHERDLPPLRHAVIAPPAEPALQPQPQRHPSRNQQEVREMILPPRRLHGRRHQPAIHGVRRSRNQAKRIAPVPEVLVARVHSRAAVASPTPNASSVFNRNFMLTSRTASVAHD